MDSDDDFNSSQSDVGFEQDSDADMDDGKEPRRAPAFFRFACLPF